MEIRARYFVIGLFVLAVVAAGVGFIYWLYNTGGLVKRTDYLVSINGSVSGLARGSPVLFNGLQVGEVTGLSLSMDDPGLVIARISIDARAPVRSDTHVGMDFRGLTGSATIALTGGTASAPPPASSDGQPPLLVADTGSIKDMTASAREALGQLNQILAANAEPLTEAISNINAFAGALARNSDKVDTILAGLENLTGGGKKPETVNYDITAPAEFPEIAAYPDSQLTLPPATTVIALDTQRIMVKNADGTVPAFEGTRWADSLPLLTQQRLIQEFENAGYTRVGTDTGGINGDYQLLVNIRSFELDVTDAPTAKVGLFAKLVSVDGKVIDAKLFTADEPVAERDKASAVASGIDAAFGKAATDMIVWSLATMSADEGGGADHAPPMQTPDMPAMDKPADAPAAPARGSRRRSGFRFGGRHCRPFGERGVPGGEPRPLVAPAEIGETEVEIGKRAADGNRADVDTLGKVRRHPLQTVEALHHLVVLSVAPFRPHQRRRAQRRFIALQQGGVGQSVGQRLLGEGPPARRTGRGEEAPAAGHRIQVFADHPAVEDWAAAVIDQGRDLSQRIVGDHRGGPLDRTDLRRDLLDLSVEPELDRRDHDLADERRGRRMVEFHGLGFPFRIAPGGGTA